MHVITYDIPEKQSNDRKKLRQYLRIIGCGLLQESVWITPYNPIDILRNFIKDKQLNGNIIIVSDIGKDGSIGEEDLHAMIIRVYRLEEINKRYEFWLKDNNHIDHGSMIEYLFILKDDPQLPFALLPSWWKGDSAYKKVKDALEKVAVLRPTGLKLTT
jgi:DNA-binding transcriptional regulator PaaX